jgi:hypothetical protein
MDEEDNASTSHDSSPREYSIPSIEGTEIPVKCFNNSEVYCPIALQKPIRHIDVPACLNGCVGYKPDIAKFITYHKCSPLFKGFIASLESSSILEN